mmetsp:Transcript_71980/g.217724  ORF Transcript_71980/g.217724 Transcript_71980/m.217724 type:complete len:391 (-) Transcript_71980:530-1702(-)
MHDEVAATCDYLGEEGPSVGLRAAVAGSQAAQEPLAGLHPRLTHGRDELVEGAALQRAELLHRGCDGHAGVLVGQASQDLAFAERLHVAANEPGPVGNLEVEVPVPHVQLRRELRLGEGFVDRPRRLAQLAGHVGQLPGAHPALHVWQRHGHLLHLGRFLRQHLLHTRPRHLAPGAEEREQVPLRTLVEVVRQRGALDGHGVAVHPDITHDLPLRVVVEGQRVLQPLLLQLVVRPLRARLGSKLREHLHQRLLHARRARYGQLRVEEELRRRGGARQPCQQLDVHVELRVGHGCHLLRVWEAEHKGEARREALQQLRDGRVRAGVAAHCCADALVQVGPDGRAERRVLLAEARAHDHARAVDAHVEALVGHASNVLDEADVPEGAGELLL